MNSWWINSGSTMKARYEGTRARFKGAVSRAAHVRTFSPFSLKLKLIRHFELCAVVDFVDRWLFLVGIITCINSACGVHLSVVPISSYKRNNGRRGFKTGFRAGFPLCLEVFVVWEITPTQRSFPISTVAALLKKHISCSCRSTCSTKRTTERLSTHRRRRSLQAVIVDRQRNHVETKWDSFDLNNLFHLFQYALQIYGCHNVLIHESNVYLPSSSRWCLE